MDKKTIVSVLIIIAGVAGLIWWGKSTEREELNANELTHPARIGAVLVASEKFYDFGTISMKNGKVSKIFSVANTSIGDIKLSSLTTSCMCTNAYILKADGSKKGPYGMPGHGGGLSRVSDVVRPGERMDIEVVYDPNAHGPAGVGRIERAVFVKDDSGNIVEFKFKVNVTP